MRIADLCCGAGGAARGLADAFPDADITGFDVVDQPRYPFRFFKQDALTVDLDGFDFVWASPPCQRYTAGRRAQRRTGSEPHPDLIGPIRERLQAWGGPYIIENVEGAPLRNPVRLCGQQFGLRVIRHRLFESNLLLLAPPHAKHTGSMLDGSIVAVYGSKWLVSGGARKGEAAYHTYGRIPLAFRTVEARRDAMGIAWMTGEELNQAIPPAYSRYLAQFIPSAEQERAA